MPCATLNGEGVKSLFMMGCEGNHTFEMIKILSGRHVIIIK